MRIDPIVRALRSDPAPQRKAQSKLQQARASWQEAPANRAALHQLAQFGSGEALADCPALQNLFFCPFAAAEFAASLVGAVVPKLSECALGHVPFRHQYSGGMAVIQVTEAGRAALSLVLYERTSQSSAAQTVCFTDSERHEMALAGSARMRLLSWTANTDGNAEISCEPLHFARGQALCLTGIHTTKQVEQVDGRLVVLRLSRTPAKPAPSMEFRLSDGALVHQASGNRQDSRHEMMLALLGKMGRSDAAPAMAAMTEDGSDHLRWQALRECLALDTGTGFAALSKLAANVGDSLAPQAAGLKDNLIRTYPALTLMENA